MSVILHFALIQLVIILSSLLLYNSCSVNCYTLSKYMLQTETLKKKAFVSASKALLLIFQGKITALCQHTQAEVAVKITTGSVKFLCGKVADPNGREG